MKNVENALEQVEGWKTNEGNEEDSLSLMKNP
jgi:hypothetical protein